MVISAQTCFERFGSLPHSLSSSMVNLWGVFFSRRNQALGIYAALARRSLLALVISAPKVFRLYMNIVAEKNSKLGCAGI